VAASLSKTVISRANLKLCFISGHVIRRTSRALGREKKEQIKGRHE
jgi:hypothetical protein